MIGHGELLSNDSYKFVTKLVVDYNRGVLGLTDEYEVDEDSIIVELELIIPKKAFEPYPAAVTVSHDHIVNAATVAVEVPKLVEKIVELPRVVERREHKRDYNRVLANVFILLFFAGLIALMISMAVHGRQQRMHSIGEKVLYAPTNTQASIIGYGWPSNEYECQSWHPEHGWQTFKCLDGDLNKQVDNAASQVGD